ncbi:MAG: hypothetical protein WD273_06325 [Trueperaceae bacterium]
MSTFVGPDDSRLGWYGAISLQRTTHSVAPWRLPVERLPLYPFEELWRQASMPAGVRVAFRSAIPSNITRLPKMPVGLPPLCQVL